MATVKYISILNFCERNQVISSQKSAYCGTSLTLICIDFIPVKISLCDKGTCNLVPACCIQATQTKIQGELIILSIDRTIDMCYI